MCASSALFSVIAAVPAILVAVVASITLDRGLDRLFSQHTQSLIQNSLIVAEAYLREQARIAARRHHRRSRSSWRAPSRCSTPDREQFHQFVNAQAAIRGLPRIMMVDNDLNVIERADIEVDVRDPAPTARGARGRRRAEPQIAAFLEDEYRRGRHQAARL